MAGPRSRQRTEKSRALPSKSEANKAAVLANAPKEVRDAVEQTCKEKQQADKQMAKAETRFQKFVASTKQAAETETGIEVLGGLSAQALNELGSFGLRALGEWSERTEGMDGFWAANVDLTQSLPGAIGTIVYIVEKALRPDFDPDDKDKPMDERRPYFVGPWRAGLSEASKVMAHLGLSNTVRALRFRWAESLDERREKDAAIKDRDKMIRAAQDEVERLKAQLRQLQGTQGGGTQAGGAGR